MPLLGWPLVITLSVVTVLVIAATCVYWGKVRGPRPVRVGARAGMLVANQLIAVLLLGCLVNDWGYFYSSWSDLLGTQSEQGHLVEAAGGGPLHEHKAVGVTQLGRSGPGTSAQRATWAKDGRLLQVHIQGRSSGLSTNGYVWLPPQYYQPAYAHTRFHGVEAMTGYPGTPVQLVKSQKYPQAMLGLIRTHQMRPTVVVMSQVDLGMRRDTECTDVYDGPQAESFLAQDVTSSIERAYRVLPGGWGAIGDSTGGYCAAKLAMLNPNVFSAAVSLSGYFTTLHDITTGSLWGGSNELENLNNLDWRLKHLPAPAVSILVTSTRQEDKSSEGLSNSLKFISLARAPLRVSTLIQSHGGHNPHTWRVELPLVLPWLSRNL